MRSITFRLASLFALATLLVLATIGYFLSRSVESHLAEMDWTEIYGKWQLTGNLVQHIRTPADRQALPQLLQSALVGHPYLFVAINTPSGESLFASRHFSFPAQHTTLPAGSQPQFPAMLTWQRNGNIFRGIAAQVASAESGAPRYTIRIAVQTEEHRRFLVHFHHMLLLALLFGMSAAAALGWFIAYRGLLPIRHMAAVTGKISASQLAERLAVESVPQELRTLAIAFNDMLARLENAFQRLTDFSADIAHELRTPINNLIIQSQVALSKSRSNEEYRDTLASNLEEFDRLARMISDMLFLAKADNGLMTAAQDDVDLNVEVEHLLEYFSPVIEEQGVSITVNGTGRVLGDRIMLQRALANLLSNAITHTPSGGEIKVTLTQQTDQLKISIQNPGPGIPPEQLDRIFDRFYRLDPSRSASPDGAGLGLAITESIIRAHKGHISASSSHGLTTFTVSLPIRS